METVMIKKFKGKFTNKVAQLTIEFILVFAAVLSVLVVFLSPKGAFQKSFNKSLTAQTDQLIDLSQQLKNLDPITGSTTAVSAKRDTLGDDEGTETSESNPGPSLF